MHPGREDDALKESSWRALFGARAQVVIGAVAFVASAAFWVLGTFIIPNAATWPWKWTPAAFIFHASMLALVIGSYAIIATGLSYRETEHVAEIVADVDVTVEDGSK